MPSPTFTGISRRGLLGALAVMPALLALLALAVRARASPTARQSAADTTG